MMVRCTMDSANIFKVSGSDFQFHVRSLLDQTLYGNHKYPILKFVTTIFQSSLVPRFHWLIKKHRQPSRKGLTVQNYT